MFQLYGGNAGRELKKSPRGLRMDLAGNVLALEDWCVRLLIRIRNGGDKSRALV